MIYVQEATNIHTCCYLRVFVHRKSRLCVIDKGLAKGRLVEDSLNGIDVLFTPKTTYDDPDGGLKFSWWWFWELRRPNSWGVFDLHLTAGTVRISLPSRTACRHPLQQISYPWVTVYLWNAHVGKQWEITHTKAHADSY